MRKSIFIAILLCIAEIVSAQFQGGIGDGQDFGYYNGLLNGDMIEMFSGSIGDGQDFGYGVALTMEPGCDLVINFNGGPIPAGTYNADQQIKADGTVSLGAVSFQSGAEVLLEPQFDVAFGQNLTINISDCIVMNALLDEGVNHH